MKHKNKIKSILVITTICVLCVTYVSCKKDNSINQDHDIILTQEAKSELNIIFDRVFLETNAPGLIALISVEGEQDFLIKRGTANLVTDKPINEDNAFRIASVTKTFTGTAVLILVDEGLISLDSTISFYLPEYGIPSGNEITVRMLGNMTSGLFDYSNDPDLWESFAQSGYTQFFPPDSLLAIAFRYPLNFPPGTNFEYCNTNTVLLGLLLEKITGKPASQVIKTKVLEPLNLYNTYFGGSYFMADSYTHGYTLIDGGLIDATNWNPSWGYTAGAMISNIEDMKKWAVYLAEGALLSENMKTERFTFNAGDYGFSVESIHYKNDIWIGHPGVIPGYNTQVWYNKNRKITIIINSNTEEGMPAQALLIEFIFFFGNL